MAMSSADPLPFPTKRIGAGALIQNPEGDVLLVEPTYKELWEIPGGLVEHLESPREAVRRECTEELGIDLEVGQLLVVHYAEGSRVPGDHVNFVFDGGVSTTAADDFDLPADELASATFVRPDDLGRFLPAVMVRRVHAAVEAVKTGAISYLER